jgi:phenylalanyl-tRNA synthetase beta chain
LKAHVESILLRLGIPVKKLRYTCFEDEIFASALSIGTFSGKKIGVLGILQKKLCEKFDIPAEVYFAELNWDELMSEHRNTVVRFSEIPKFPAVRRDLALLVDPGITFADIERIAYQADKKLLKDVNLFDVYEGKNLPEGKKSYAVSFILQDEEKTLTDFQIESIMSKIQKKLEERLITIRN